MFFDQWKTPFKSGVVENFGR